MGMGRLTRHMLPPGPILSLALIGVMVLSALLYYRAVKIQRFLEPALALSQPRNQLSERLNVLLRREFGDTAGVRGMSFGMGAVIAEARLFFDEDEDTKKSAGEVLQKLNRVFYKALQDERTRLHIAVVLVGADYRIGPAAGDTKDARERAQHRAELVMDRMLSADPRLISAFGTYFIAAAIPAGSQEAKGDRLEFRIIPSEMLHVEVLMKLNKYVR